MHNHHLLRRTKIITTLGPATDNPDIMMGLIHAGVNLVRLNFSHGSHEEHKKRIKLVRSVAQQCGRVVGILADMQGPKIRIASFQKDQVTLEKGERFILDASLDSHAGTEKVVGIDYKELPQDVSENDVLLLDDGRLTLVVEKVEDSKIHCLIEVGGVLSNHKGINRQGGGLSAKALTDKDRDDIKFAYQMQVDYVAISFPRHAEDVAEAKALVGSHKDHPAVNAKIERVESVHISSKLLKSVMVSWWLVVIWQ